MWTNRLLNARILGLEVGTFIFTCVLIGFTLFFMDLLGDITIHFNL